MVWEWSEFHFTASVMTSIVSDELPGCSTPRSHYSRDHRGDSSTDKCLRDIVAASEETSEKFYFLINRRIVRKGRGCCIKLLKFKTDGIVSCWGGCLGIDGSELPSFS